MKQYRLVDNVMGWLAFAIAAFVYCSTIEPTASFWDCPEFITTGYKLEVGHPPGAPFFMLTANLFSQFASDPSQVAYMVNIMSALLSATTILFLFWTITHLTRKLMLIDSWERLTTSKLIAIEASGLVGALIYTFSDTFWFSAVEGEVYAYSSAFTAVVFWLILKWEDHADEPHSDRWLVLIAYMTGLSIGVHLLNLLCLPAIVLVYYYKRFPNANLKGLAHSPAHLVCARGRRALRRRAGHHHRGRMVRAVLRQHAGHALQHGRHHLHAAVGGHRHLGHLREPARQEPPAAEHRLPAGRGHAGHPLLRLWLDVGPHRHRRAGLAWVVLNGKNSRRRSARHHGPHEEHHAALHAHADDWLFHVCRHRHPLVGQPADGPELARGHLHPGQLPEPRPVWRPPAVLRTGLHLAGGA